MSCEVRSFSLTPDVIALLDRIPRRKRSYTVNSILHAHLPHWSNDAPATPAINIEQIRAIVLQVMADNQTPPSKEAVEKGKTRAFDALAEILGMREL